MLRVGRLLEAVFRVAKIPIREFENRIGMGSGTLTRIFRGEIDLKFRHVFDVLDGLGVSHEEFFRLVYKDRPERGEVLAREVMGLLDDHLPARREPLQEGKPDEPVSDDDLDRRIQKALRDYGIVPEAGGPPGKGGSPKRRGRPE